MVKGTAKRVIVVKSPDKKVFEEAIFIVREDYMRTSGMTQSKLMDEARAAAGGYLGTLRRRPRSKTALLVAKAFRLPQNVGRRPRSKTALLVAISSLSGSAIAYAALKIFGI